MLTMGSLFDGIGGFPLAAVRNGVTPVWASEIEAFPIEVTKERFPDMIHVGDITKLNGASCRPWISSAAAARVRIYPLPEREPGLPARAPAFLWNKAASSGR
jgi:DNA (cytosine-5)-methyltransferase 1